MVILMLCSIHSFQGILRVHFGDTGQLNTLSVRYAMVSRLSQLQARLDLLIDCYLWAFHLYHQERVHIQHHWIIFCSFAWAGFALASLTIPGKGRAPTESPLDARPRTRSRVMPMTLSSMQKSSRRATLS